MGEIADASITSSHGDAMRAERAQSRRCISAIYPAGTKESGREVRGTARGGTLVHHRPPARAKSTRGSGYVASATVRYPSCCCRSCHRDVRRVTRAHAPSLRACAGTGKCAFADGHTYEGPWVDGVPQGDGALARTAEEAAPLGESLRRIVLGV